MRNNVNKLIFSFTVLFFICTQPIAQAKGSNLTDLMWACLSGDEDKVRQHILIGNINTQTKLGNTALMYASGGNNLEKKYVKEEKYQGIVQILLENGADPNIKNNDGNTALIAAAYHGYLNIARLLLNNGANPNIKNNFGFNALMYASYHCNAELVETLLGLGIFSDTEKESAIKIAIAEECKFIP